MMMVYLQEDVHSHAVSAFLCIYSFNELSLRDHYIQGIVLGRM